MKINRRKFCECGCGQRVKKSIYYPFSWNRFICGHNKNRIGSLPWNKGLTKKTDERLRILSGHLTLKVEKGTAPLCACGCNKLVHWNRAKRHWNKYILGHNSWKQGYKEKIEIEGKHFCQCGCHKEIFIKAHHYLSGVPKYITGHDPMTEKEKKLLSQRFSGENNPSRSPRGRRRLKRLAIRNWNNSKYREEHSGANHHNWQGGISFEPYSQEFSNRLKQSIRLRDGYRCQICLRPQNELSKNLHVHHIDYNKKNCEEDNLISLCSSCHVKTNKDRKGWQSVFASQ